MPEHKLTWVSEVNLASALTFSSAKCWLADLRQVAPQLDELQASLSEDERQRAARFMVQPARVRYVGTRAALRSVLGRECGIAAASIEFAYSPTGKPFMLSSPEKRVHFNVAHSGDLALLAVCPSREIGVDLERLQPHIEAQEIATRFFAAQESELVRTAPAGDRLRRFYTIWTRKEAILKASGLGISSGLHFPDVSIGLDHAVSNSGLAVDSDGRQWLVHDVDFAPDYFGAIAVAL